MKLADIQEQGACAGRTDLNFFPPAGANPHKAVIECCAACPIREPCLEYAMAHPSLNGYWGGTTEEARRRARRAKNRHRQTPLDSGN